ncbi:MAG TPA: hypothetical protein DEP87_01695 [Candidatus Pacebacteria bacterium]|nr:hypothetical protein [Candidatus Paceibacterota bacterium]
MPTSYLLEKPDESGVDVSKIIDLMKNDSEQYKKIVQSANEPSYIYWDKFRHKAQPDGLSAEEQWTLVSLFRDISSTETPIKAKNGNFFKWLRLPSIDEYLHEIDMLVGGQIFPKSKVPTGNREMYITRGVIEEAIASSQLEGAHTTRAVAKKLILEKRKPRNESEQMIVNNYRAMVALEEEFKSRPLSQELLYELHSMLTDGTVDESEQKRFRNNKDEIVVQGNIGNETYVTHVPPNEEFLNAEIYKLIAYANGEPDQKFVHPIIKAIFIHFWIGYLHPFTDGNGRLARAIFYWYLLKNDYWAFTYIPISTIIKRSPIQYAMAYIYSEQDRNDLTYFFDYNLKKVIQAMKEFNEYISRQFTQNHQIDQILSKNQSLNERQKQLLYYFISDTEASTTTSSHSTINKISRQTATKDLKELKKYGYVASQRAGKFIKFFPTEQLKKIVS